MEQIEIPLEDTWRQKADKYKLVAEGDYLAEVERLEQTDNNCFKTVLRILSNGPELNRVLHERFNMDSYPEKFYELLAAIEIDEHATKVTIDQIVGARIGVTVKHRKDGNGRYWVNVVQYHAKPG